MIHLLEFLFGICIFFRRYGPNVVFGIMFNHIIIIEESCKFRAIVQNINVFFAMLCSGENSYGNELGLFTSHFNICHVI